MRRGRSRDRPAARVRPAAQESQRFGARSERIHRDQLGLFNEAEALAAGGAGAPEEEPEIGVAAHARRPRGRRQLPAWMPREEILHDLPEAEKVCPHAAGGDRAGDLGAAAPAAHPEEPGLAVAARLRGGHPLILYEYDPSRSAEVPKRLLEGFKGVLQTDGYEGYGAVGREPGIVHVGCWAHARRRITDALKGQGPHRKKGAKRRTKHSQAGAGLRLVQELYAIERRLREATPEERLRVRQAESLPVVASLRAWLDRAPHAVVPQSLTGKAVAYLDAQWPKLVHGFVPLDTNPVENAVRPFALGRKDWLFADTVGGAEASANLYSVIETAKANGIEPWAYLEHVFAELPKARSFDDVDALLPDRVQSAQGRRSLSAYITANR